MPAGRGMEAERIASGNRGVSYPNLLHVKGIGYRLDHAREYTAEIQDVLPWF
jgi:hypothetical protein